MAQVKIKDFDRAINLTDSLIQDYPESIKAKSLKGHVLVLKGDLAEAEKAAKITLSACSNPPASIEEKEAAVMAHQTLSNVYTKRGDMAAAISETEEGLKLMPDSEILIWQLAVTYAGTGKYEKAKAKANRLIEIGDNGKSKGVMADYAKKLLLKIDSME